jgi:hypothetical protein
MTNKHHEEILEACANGNPFARQFCVALYEFLHLIDDLVDRDVSPPPTDEQIGKLCVQLILTIGGNPFYQDNRPALEALILRGFGAWLDANELERNQKVEGKVLKSWYHELFWHVSTITGGWDRSRDICRKYRAFDMSEEEVPHGLLR